MALVPHYLHWDLTIPYSSSISTLHPSWYGIRSTQSTSTCHHPPLCLRRPAISHSTQIWETTNSSRKAVWPPWKWAYPKVVMTTSYNVPTKFSTTPKNEEVIHMDGSENNANYALYFWPCYKRIRGAELLESSKHFGWNYGYIWDICIKGFSGYGSSRCWTVVVLTQIVKDTQ